jgi:hypothetical protein
MKYDVHIYAIVRVKVAGVEANTQRQAIDKAEMSIDLKALFDPRRFFLVPGVEAVEYAGAIDGYVVEEQGNARRKKIQAYSRRKRKARLKTRRLMKGKTP